MIRRSTWLLAAALVMGAQVAQAQTDSSPAPAPAISNDSGSVSTGAAGNPFGMKGQLVLSDVPPVSIPVFSGASAALGAPGSPSATIGYVTGTNGGSGSFILGLAPAVDYFIVDHVSVGGGLGFTFDTGGGSSITSLSLVPRAGYDIPATPKISVWPRLGLDLSVVSYGGNTNTNFGVAIDAPIIYHATDHFFFGGSPTLNVGLTGDYKVTSFSLDFILGGWM